MKLIFASHNHNKIAEIKALLPSHIELITLEELGYTTEIEETGNTLEENAQLKAHTIYNTFGYACFADDSGLEVVALNNAPGVYSARYAGKQKKAQDNINKLLSALAGIQQRQAQFKTVIHLKSAIQDIAFTGIVQGEITNTPKGTNGFGYDPIFIPLNHSITFAEMTPIEKAKLSHRARALQQLITFLEKTT